MGKYFGTDGFRGEANVNLTVDHAVKIFCSCYIRYAWCCCNVQKINISS